MTCIGRADLLDDPRFANWQLRMQNEEQLVEVIEAALSTKSAKEWEPILEAAGAPCTSIHKLEETIEHPQVVARNVLQTVETPYGPLRFVGSGFKLAHGNGSLDRMAPALGQHSEELLLSAGYTQSEIDVLRSEKVI